MLGSAPLDRLGDPQLLLVGDRVVALGAATPSPSPVPPAARCRSRRGSAPFDVSDPTRPTEVDSRRYDGRLVDRAPDRRRGPPGAGRLTARAALRDARLHAPRGSRAARATGRSSATRRSPTGCPTVAAGAGPAHALVACSDVAVPEDDGGLGTLSVVGFRASAPARTADTTAVATSSDMAYLSPDLLVVAASPRPAFGCCLLRPLSGAEMAPDAPTQTTPRQPDERTHLYAFDLDGHLGHLRRDRCRRRAGREQLVDGRAGRRAARRRRGGAGGTANAVVLLRPEAGRLVEVGRLDGLGPDQQIRSMRWLGDPR